MKTSKYSVAKKILGVSIPAAGTLFLCACTPNDPEDPGFNKPAVTGVVRGDIHSVGEYADAVEKENNRRISEEGDRLSNPDGF